MQSPISTPPPEDIEMEAIMSVMAKNRQIKHNTFSSNLLSGAQKDNPDLQYLWGLLPYSNKLRCPSPSQSEDGEGESDDEPIVDYFVGVKHDDRAVATKQPPQNMIKPKNWNILKKKYSSTSFRPNSKKRKRANSEFKFFEIV